MTPRWSAASIAPTLLFEGGGLVGLAVVPLGDPRPPPQQLLLAADRLVLHLHMGVEGDEAAILSSASGLISARVMSFSRRGARGGARTGVARFSSEPVTPVAGDRLLRLEVGDREEIGDVAAADVVGMLLGDLLDVDPAHVAEQHQRPLAGAVPDDRRRSTPV